MISSTSATEKLVTLTNRLEDNLNKQEESASESFLIYLEFCAYMFENKGSIREVFNLIKKIKDSHALAQINKIYPDKKNPGREKALKLKRQEVSDKMTLAGKEILQFLIDINENRITQNVHYRVLQLSLNEDQKDSLSAWITELPNDLVFQNVINPRKICEERLFLTVSHSRNNFRTISEEAVDTILNLSQTHKNSGADVTMEDINKYWDDKHSEMKIITNPQRVKLLQLLNEFRREYNLNEVEDEEDLESISSAVPERDTVPLPEEEVNAVDSVQIVEEIDRTLFGMDAVDFPTEKEDLVSSTSSAVPERDTVPLPEEEVNAVDSVQVSDEETAQVRQNTIDSFMHFLLERNLSSSELQFVGKRIWTVLEEKCKKKEFPHLFSNVFCQEPEEPSRLEMEHDPPLPWPKDLETVEEEVKSTIVSATKVVKKPNFGDQVGSIHGVLNHILDFVHPKLFFYMVDSRYQPKPRKLPFSLYVRACRHRSTFVLPFEKVFVAVVKDRAWSLEPFLWFTNAFPRLVANFQKWPTCVTAYEEANRTFKPSSLILHWARRNRCSCQYNVQNLMNLSGNEIEVLRLLEKNARQFLQQRPHFRDNYDTPILYSTLGNCLWTTFMNGSNIVRPNEAADEEDLFAFTDITNATQLEIKAFPHQSAEYILQCIRNSPATQRKSISKTISSPKVMTIWDFTDDFNSIVDDQVIKVVAFPFNRPRLFAALTFLAHATRLEILQNNNLRHCLAFREFCSILFSTTYEVISAEYPSVQSEDVINLMLQRTTSSQLHRSKFHVDYVVESEIIISLRDTPSSIGDNVCRGLRFNADSGLYVFRVTADYIDNKSNIGLASDNFFPILFRKDRQCFQTFGCIYEDPSGVVLFRFITRSLKGLKDDQYIFCNYLWSTRKLTWSTHNSQILPEDGKIFPFQINGLKLTVILLIPTATQSIPDGEPCFSMQLVDEEELISEHWSVKDQLSLGDYRLSSTGPFHLTEMVLRDIAFDLMSEYNFAIGQQPQSCFVSASLIDDIQSTIFSPQFPISSQLVKFAEEFLFANFNCVVHVFVSYKDANGINNWVYTYFLGESQSLIITSRRSDPVREILAISSSIKSFLDRVLNSQIKTVQLLWRDVSLCHGNSGYYALKQFWINANKIKTIGHHLHSRDTILKIITRPQVEQLKIQINKRLFPIYSKKGFYIPAFLLND